MGRLARNRSKTIDRDVRSHRQALLDAKEQQLKAIIEARQDHLKELYALYKSRENIGAPVGDQVEEDVDWHQFLEEFTLKEDGSGSIENFAEWDLPPIPPSPLAARDPEPGPSNAPEPEVDEQQDHTLSLPPSPHGPTPSPSREGALPTIQISQFAQPQADPADSPLTPVPMHVDEPLPVMQSIAISNLMQAATLPPTTTASPAQLQLRPTSLPPAYITQTFEFDPNMKSSDLPPPPALLPPVSSAYTLAMALPSMQNLPPELNRKVHPAKAFKRREKDQAKEGKENRAPAWLPMEVNRWHATIQANPAFKMVRKAHKCLTTQEWMIAHRELILLRTLERVDRLKADDMWSFRQPKKQKGPALAKGHWGYLLDEMKWLQTDFKEERKWKLALAYQMAQYVMEWHNASTQEEKLALRSGYRPPDPEPSTELVDKTELEGAEMDALEQGVPMDVDAEKGDQKRDDSEEEGDDNDQDAASDGGGDDNDPMDTQHPVVVTIPDGAEAVQEEIERIENGAADVEMKIEEPEPPNLDLHKTAETTLPVAVQPISQSAAQLATIALKPTSSDPILDSTSNPAPPESDAIAPNAARPIKPSSATNRPPAGPQIDYKTARAPLLQLDRDALWADLQQVDVSGAGSSSSSKFMSSNRRKAAAGDNDTGPPSEDLASVTLTALFPELTMFVALPTSTFSTDSIVGSSANINAPKMDKRVDEATPGRVVNLSRWMDHKPYVVSALQPARRWRGGKWIGLDETPVVGDDGPTPMDTVVCSLFGRRKPGSARSAARAPPARASSPSSMTPRAPRDPQARANLVTWLADEDNLLKSLVDRYPDNWTLVSDLFNSMRATVPTDARTPWDCWDRWGKRWGPSGDGSTKDEGGNKDGKDATTRDETPEPSRDGQRTRGTVRKRADSALPNPSYGQGEGRIFKRHKYVHEAIKKCSKKREAAKLMAPSPRRANPQAHETHGNYTKLTHYTPSELSRHKAEQDMKRMQDRQALERRQIEALRAQRMQQLAAQQGQQPGAVRPPGATPPGVPQIRTNAQQGVPNIAGQQGTQTGATAVTPTSATQPGAPAQPATNMQPVPNIAQLPNIAQQSQLPRVATPAAGAAPTNAAAVQRMSPNQQAMFHAQVHKAAIAAGGPGPGTPPPPSIQAHISPPRPGTPAIPGAQASPQSGTMPVPRPPSAAQPMRPGMMPMPGYTAEQMNSNFQMQQMLWARQHQAALQLQHQVQAAQHHAQQQAQQHHAQQLAQAQAAQAQAQAQAQSQASQPQPPS